MQGKAPAGQVALSTPAGTLPPASSKAMVFPARPGYGTVGRRCQVRANHVLVQLADKDIYHYDVRIHDPGLSVSPTKPYKFQENHSIFMSSFHR